MNTNFNHSLAIMDVMMTVWQLDELQFCHNVALWVRIIYFWISLWTDNCRLRQRYKHYCCVRQLLTFGILRYSISHMRYVKHAACTVYSKRVRLHRRSFVLGRERKLPLSIVACTFSLGLWGTINTKQLFNFQIRLFPDISIFGQTLVHKAFVLL